MKLEHLAGRLKGGITQLEQARILRQMLVLEDELKHLKSQEVEIVQRIAANSQQPNGAI